jgi:eukaryotic-like serine/threonine-protein kinase
MASRAPDQDFLVGSELGHYRIAEKIGAGGMGDVYRARDEHLARDVAIKVLPPGTLTDASARKHFHKEALILSQLNHPNVATIHDFDTQQGVDFLVMEYIPGITLSEKVAAGPLPEKEVLRLGVQLAEGLAAAHERGVVHRDLKPGNLRITSDGRLKILDFGLAKLWRPVTASAATESLSETQAMAGTLPYMAPEQLLGGEVDARTDIHAAGSVLYEMATGQRPFGKLEHAQLIAAILRQAPPPPGQLNPQVLPELERIIGKCLEKEPENRYQSAKELAIDLRRLQTGVVSAVQLAATPARWSFAKSVGLGLGILASVIVLLIALNVGRLRERVLGRADAPRIESLAVLPVKNFSGDPSQEFFADGMTDELIAGLAQIKAIKVISRTSVMHYKGTSETLPQIARELGVDGIVEASVMRSGDRVRLTAQLIDARQDRHLWANNYERDMTDVLALQSELVQTIAGEIRVQVTPQESERLKVARRVDPEVYDTTLKAKAVLEYATREEQFRQAIELFQKAVDRDPTYAPAWAGLGEALWSLAETGFEFVAPGEVRDKAIAAAEKALELDPNLADAHKARAVIAGDGEWDVAKAQQHFERALELRPSYAAAHNLYGQILSGAPLRRFDEARSHLDRARALDPLSPWNDINLDLWWIDQGQLERAFEEGERARQRNPTLWIIPWQMGFAQLLLGQPSQAVPEFEAALKLLHPDRPAAALAPLGLAYGLSGRRADALKILAEMEQASKKRYISPYYLAVVYSGLGRMDEAFRLLDRALGQRTPYLVVFCTPYDPNSVALRRDPRWKSFIDRLRRLVRLPPRTPDPYS